jgi:hypothetical protein
LRRRSCKERPHYGPVCSLFFPPSAVPGETTYAFRCSEKVSSVALTRTVKTKAFSKWAIVRGTSLKTGSCTGGHTTTVTCNLGGPLLIPGATFIIGIAPPAKVGESIKAEFEAVPLLVIEKFIANAGPKLTVTTAVTPDTSPTAPAGTAFDFSVTIGGGKFYKFAFTPPPGNTVLFESKQPTNGLQCGAQVGEFTCFEQGLTPLPPGSFTFAIELSKPVSPGTFSHGRVWGTGLEPTPFRYQW